MCGIAGIIDSTLTSDDLRNIGNRILQATQHRGPDNQGVWQENPLWLGHNRLSIIDLSSASHQPLAYRYNVMTYNGEVYNYVELRTELQKDGYTFTTQGDTEVILAAYHKWGHKCVDHFIGMWAFAIWDPAKRELFCSRDRFGIKPFHYVEQNGRLYFCSEIKGLKQSPLFTDKINEQQVVRGLYLGWMHHWEETYFDSIKSLPAAHNLVWKDNRVTISHYAKLPTVQHETSFENSVQDFRELFIDSVQLTARRDVAMGVCLSGGLDSTSIACVLASQTNEHDVKTFTAYYTGKGNVDERPYINHVLKRYPSISDSYISPTDNDVAEVLHNVVGIMDAPMPSSSYISQYFVMQLAAQHGVKVVLDGQGSDEIMGGYMHSMYRVIADLLVRGNAVGAIAEWNAHSARQSYGTKRKIDVLAKSVLTAVRDEPQLYRLELARAFPWVMNASASSIPLHLEMPTGSKLNAFLHNLVHVTLLPTLLHTEDLNSMAHSIESRVPFLDHRLVELCFSMPNSHKVHRGETKRVLRAAMRGIVPDEVLDRKDKTGFITPGHSIWLRGALKHVLDGNWSEISDYANVNEVKSLVADYRNGNDVHGLFIWRLAMLREFLKSK